MQRQSSPNKLRTYAVLGATGGTGAEVTKHLLKREDIRLHVYARSASKVSRAFPSLESSPHSKTFISPLSDLDNLSACLDGVDTIFSCVAQNVNDPKCSVAIDTAQAIIRALERLSQRAKRQGMKWTSPKLVFLASASLNPENAKDESWLFRKILYYTNWYVYEDLRHSIEYLKAEASWLPLIIVSPPGIVHSEEEGFDFAARATTISYIDLGAGMIAMAEQENLEGYVGIGSLGPPKIGLLLRSVWSFLLPNAITTTFPWMLPTLQWLGCFY